MSERRYFVLCADHCLFEAMSKEQTLAAIMQAVKDGEIGDIDGGVVSKVSELNKGANLSFWVGTEAEYNALGLNGKSVMCRIGDDGNVYVCTDDSVIANLEELAEKVDSLPDLIPDSFTSTEEFFVTVKTTDWSKGAVDDNNPNTWLAIVTVSGLLNTDTPIVDVDLRAYASGTRVMGLLEAFACVHRAIVFGDDTLYLYCYNGAPVIDLPLRLLVVR